MNDKLRTYTSDDIDVTWSQRRCVHVKACVQGLSNVFDTSQKPWVQPGNASADAVAETVLRCPTGALHFERKDGGSQEEVPEENTVCVQPDGPLALRGQVRVLTPSGEVVLEDTRLALCRCGASGYQPFCDGSHKEANFRDRGVLGNVQLEGSGNTEGLEVSPVPNGPLMVRGPFTLTGADGDEETGARAALCRCGASGNKPFCDGTHARVGFTSEDQALHED